METEIPTEESVKSRPAETQAPHQESRSDDKENVTDCFIVATPSPKRGRNKSRRNARVSVLVDEEIPSGRVTRSNVRGRRGGIQGSPLAPQPPAGSRTTRSRTRAARKTKPTVSQTLELEVSNASTDEDVQMDVGNLENSKVTGEIATEKSIGNSQAPTLVA